MGKEDSKLSAKTQAEAFGKRFTFINIMTVILKCKVSSRLSKSTLIWLHKSVSRLWYRHSELLNTDLGCQQFFVWAALQLWSQKHRLQVFQQRASSSLLRIWALSTPAYTVFTHTGGMWWNAKLSCYCQAEIDTASLYWQTIVEASWTNYKMQQ